MTENTQNSRPWTTRTELLLGAERLQRLRAAHVLVVGLGGVGGIASEMTARSGVGRMTIADGDIVEESNLNRQTAALTTTLKRMKTDVMAERIRAINPEIQLETIGEFLDETRMAEVLSANHFDCVLDAIDSVVPKVKLMEYCYSHNIKLVSSMGSGARMNPELIRVTDISKTYSCGLARVVRKRLRDLGITSGIKVVFSGEEVNKNALTSDAVGTISYMPNAFGCFCAYAVIDTLLQQN